MGGCGSSILQAIWLHAVLPGAGHWRSLHPDRSYYLSWLARQYDFQTDFIALAAETNENMPFYVKNMVLRDISMMPVTFPDA